MQAQTLLEKISEFVCKAELFDMPSEVIETAVDGITDYCAVGIAGAHTPVSENVFAYLGEKAGKGSCQLLGRREKAAPEEAALFNGTASHSLDFDDVSWATIGHPSVAVAPAVFAACSEQNLPGTDYLKAYILGVEGMHQIARLSMPQLSENGWHTTLANGVFGAAIAAGLARRLDPPAMTNALAIAASRAGGVRANFGSQTKALHAGLCARIGIDSVLLAQAGITGRSNALEAQDGYFQCFAKGADASRGFDMGDFWDLKENGLVFKRYPCCSGSHPTNDVLDEYLSTHSLNPEDIEEIYAGVSLLGPRELNCHLPQDAVQAKFSLEFAISHRILFGPLKIESFTNERVLDPRLQAMMKKVRMEISPELAKLGFIGTALIRMTIRLKNGEKIDLANDLALGNPEKPFSAELKKEKFFDCVVPAAGEEKAKEWFRILRGIQNATAEEMKGIGAV